MAPHLDNIGFVVKDMARALAFYRLLGLDLPDELNDEKHVETKVGDLRIAFDTVEIIRSFTTYEAPSGGHRMNIAFLCDSPAEVDTTHARLVDAGYHSQVEPFDAYWGQRYATVLDPDFNPVDLFAPLDAA